MDTIQLITPEDLEFFKDCPELIEEFRESERKINAIYHHLVRGESTFVSIQEVTNYRREAYVHESPSPDEYKRVTTFDEHGPIGHFSRRNIKEISEELNLYGFKPLSKENLKILY